MRKLAIILLLLLVPYVTLAEENSQTTIMDEYLISENFNGRYWLGLKENEKALYITGMIQGIVMCAEPKIKFEQISGISADKETIRKVYQWQEMYLPYETPMADIIAYIDEYYKNSSNLDKPINNAYYNMAEDMLVGEAETEVYGRMAKTIEKMKKEEVRAKVKEIDFSDGVNKDEAILIAQDYLIEKKLDKMYLISSAKVIEEHKPGHWSVQLSTIHDVEVQQGLKWGLVFINKKTGQIKEGGAGPS